MKVKLTPYKKAGYDWFELLNDICPTNEYRSLPPFKIPLPDLPITLMPKVRGTFLVNSGNTGTISYVMLDFHRDDKGIIDLQPLIMCFDHEKDTGIAVSIDHPNFTGRSYDPYVASGLFATTGGVGLIACTPGLWMQEHVGSFADLAEQFPRESKAFSYSVSMLKNSHLALESMKFIEVGGTQDSSRGTA